MWPFRSTKPPVTVFLTNTQSGTKEPFIPLRPGVALVYSCGPTVYSRQHLGNLRAAIFSDTLARVLKASGYTVHRVTNITDVGHLTGDNEGDADTGEDRVERSARESGEPATVIAERYTSQYLADIRTLGVDTDDILFPKATTYIPEQIALVQALEKLGHTYRTADGMYFDTSTYPGYGAFRAIPTNPAHARVHDNGKRHPADFAVWRFSPLGVRRQQEWPSPWGRGFPGWHLECSAMIKALLGVSIDIHTGGIEHIGVHHTNEIAQSEAVSHKPLARYWLHQEHLTLNGQKMAKSQGTAVYLSDVTERGHHPLALRYLFLQAHYRSPLSFTWESLTAADEGLKRLWKLSREIGEKHVASPLQDTFMQYVRDDMSTARGLAFLWESLRSGKYSDKELRGLLETAESVFGLSLTTPPCEEPVPEDVMELVRKREEARARKDYAEADALRIHIDTRGYAVDDGPSGTVVVRK
jgi:cysteinyl-tRNA synthetase